MLGQNDKNWIEDTIDRKLDEKLNEKLGAMKSDIITEIGAIFENTYVDYLKILSEILPDKVRSFDRLEEKQHQQQEGIIILNSITKDHEKRIATLEKAMVR